jgi:hypothetical protein
MWNGKFLMCLPYAIHIHDKISNLNEFGIKRLKVLSTEF